jgi:hypothetical protein
VLDEVTAIAASMGQSFGYSAAGPLVAELIRINQQTLFDDLRNDAVHAEIIAWIRTSKRPGSGHRRRAERPWCRRTACATWSPPTRS